MEAVFTGALGREVALRDGMSDKQVWADTFTGLYHLPPDDMRAPATVLDLGANIGLTAAHYRAIWPEARIVAVELDEDNAALAAENASGVRVVCIAVSAKGGATVYDASARSEAYAIQPPAVPPASGEKAVVSYTLREIILRYFEEQPVDFVKMDVEGEEWELFRHPSWAPLVRNLLVELHDADASANASDGLVARAVEILEALGFYARWHARHPRAVFAWR